MNTKTSGTDIFAGLRQKIADYEMLVKFRLTMLVIFTAGCSYIITLGVINWAGLVILCSGGFLITAAANALNQVLEREYDKNMNRTANRPLATGRMSVSEAVLFAGFSSMIGTALLSFFNPLTGLLGMVSLILYAFIYTPMKRISPTAVLIGAIPGALPMLIGSVAATGYFTPLAIVLFGIQFLWQFPHFWAIGWVSYDDYANAGFYLLPGGQERDGRNKNTALQSLFYALLLLPVGMMPWMLGITGTISMVVVVLAGLGFSYYAFNLYKKCDKKAALGLMFSSFLYLPIVLFAFLFDIL